MSVEEAPGRRGSGRRQRLRIKHLRDYATLVPPGKDFPLSAFTSRVDPASRAIGYGKAREVTHYGPYSWLVFSDGVNRGKGTWLPSAIPLARDVPP